MTAKANTAQCEPLEARTSKAFWPILVILLLAKATVVFAAAPATWDDYGCRADDPKFDNGPVLSRMLREMASRTLKVCPVGTLADYYIRTPIEWGPWAALPNGRTHPVFGGALVGGGGYTYAINGRIGATRIIWNGPAGGTMLRYSAAGGRIAQLILSGAPPVHPDYAPLAGVGIEIQGNTLPPTGNLVTDQLSITQCDVGFQIRGDRVADHADNMKHHSLLFHKVRVPYWVDNPQSINHWFYGVDIREGWETAFKFDRGGCLHVYGCYVGGGGDALKTLLYVGRATDHNGDYEIHGLQVDGGMKNVRFVDHGKYVFRVRINGSVAFTNQLAEPIVVARDGETPFADIRIDARAAAWPKEMK